jgi:hypothetical protein
MEREKSYKIIIGILVFIIILQGVFIIVTRPKRILKVPVVIKGRIAIVIDDWGYNLNNLNILDQIKYPLTISILPNLSYSLKAAEELQKRGLEIILHLPMEPKEKYRLEKNTVMVSMSEGTIKNIIEQDLNNIIYAKGISNHMGSRATEDPKIMEIVFKQLKKRHLYFLDSLVSSNSVCYDLAKKMNLRFAKRDVFLDNKEEPEYIKQQIYKLKTRARIYGQAIGIGHDQKTTLEVLKEAMPELEKEGFKFVYVSELVR